MHVLMTTDTIGGVWTFTQELASGLLAKNWRVTLVSFGRQPSHHQQRWAGTLASLHGNRFVYVPTTYRLEWMPEAGEEIEDSQHFLNRLASVFAPDLVHANQFAFAECGIALPCVLTVHSDVFSWWNAVHSCDPPDLPWTRKYRQLVARAAAGAALMVAPTRWMLDEFTRIYGRMDRYQVIPNGRSGPTKIKQSRVLQAVSAGRIWDRGKNTQILDEVVSPIPILVAGECREPASSSPGIDLRESGASTRWLGALEDNEVHDLFAQSAIYIATSRYEPFGIAPLEAALHGCALICNDIPSFHEVWQDSAAYFARDSADALSETLQLLARDARLRQQLAERARARALQLYDPARMIDSYISAYEQLVEEPTAIHA